MHSFHYRAGRLFCEGVDLEALAGEHDTPLYVYSAETILDHFRRLDAAFGALDHLVCYAVKANSNLAVLDLLAREGAGFDIVSAGELFRVRRTGGAAGKCTFAGVAKTATEIEYALREGVLAFNVESEEELARIDTVAGRLGVRAPVAVRVNPEVAAGGHKHISTGTSENKFGVAFDRVRALYADAAARRKNVALRGVQFHIGSQITEAGPFAAAVEKMVPLAEELKRAHGIEFLSIGGGLGIVYRASLESGSAAWWRQEEESETRPATQLTVEAYADALVPLLRGLGLRILLEPGRLIVGNAGVLLTRVQYRKETASGKKFVIVDAGMNDLIRPALYDGWHEIVPVRESPSGEPVGKETADVVGPVCESGDFFAQDRELPRRLEPGELVALMSAGAYGFAMASNYNSRPLPAEILVQGDRATLVRERQTLADLIRGERLAG